ncbi:MAG: hypothetical protein MI919_25295, partial [Holophagales bacterium]|nr:hypothetical protein [Holophagales bacterium]
GVVGAQGPVGNAFQVKAFTTGDQDRPDVVFRTDGSLVVVWDSDDQGTCPTDIFSNRFDGTGDPLDTESQVSQLGSGLFQRHMEPAVAADAQGNFVVAWFITDQDGEFAAYGRRFASNGTPEANSFEVGIPNLGPSEPDVARVDDGRFVVVWHTGGELSGQRYNSLGSAVGGEIPLSSSACGGGPCQGSQPAVAMDPDGGFVAAWSSPGADGNGTGIVARRFAADGSPLGPDTVVNTFTFGQQQAPAVAVARDGTYFIVWSADELSGQFFDREGSPIGEEILIDQIGPSGTSPSVAVDSLGRFVVLYSRPDIGTGGNLIVSRAYDASGQEISPRFQVSSQVGEELFGASVSAASGGFVAVWSSTEDQDGDLAGVFGSRCVLPADFVSFGELLGPLPELALDPADFAADFTADLDGDEELEVVRSVPGLADGTFARLNSVDGGNDPDPDVIAVGGTVAAVVDLDGDGEPEILIEDASAAPGTFTRVNSLDGGNDPDPDLVFVGGTFSTLVDLDGDGELEALLEDPTLPFGGFARINSLDGGNDPDPDLVFVGGTFAQSVDLDDDGESEVILQSDTAVGGTFTRINSLDGGNDPDPDLVFVGGAFAGTVDLDDDGEEEALIENAAAQGGTFTRVNSLDGGNDPDPDLVFVGGRLAAFVDVDDDMEKEAILENPDAMDGASSRVNSLDGGNDPDPDLVFVGGTVQGAVDLDGDFEAEVLIGNPSAAGGTITRVNSLDGGNDPDPDLVFVGGTAVGAGDLDGDGELEALIEDPDALGGSFSRINSLDGGNDPDPDLVFVGGSVALLGDVDGDCEVEALVENPDAAGGTFSRINSLDGGNDPDPDLVFVGGVAAGSADVDDDREPEWLISNPDAAGGDVQSVTSLDGGNDPDPDLVFVGGLPLGIEDLDDDGEPEVVAEDPNAAPGTVSRFNSLDGGNDPDPDVVFVGGEVVGSADLDDDSERELLVELFGTGTQVSRFNSLDGGNDPDPDVVFFGSVFAAVADTDSDEELEVLVSSDAVPARQIQRFTTLDGGNDPDDDLLFVGGQVVGTADLDSSGNAEILVDDATAPAGTFSILSDPGEGGPEPLAVFVGTGVAELLQLLTPNGGESLQIGSQLTVEWSAATVPGNMRIQISRDGGATFQNLFGNTPNDGTQVWNVVGPPTTEALLRVVSRDDPAVFDVSDATFTILPAAITVTAPNGGESVRIGSQLEITWNSTDLAGNVRIQISRDGGATFQSLFGNTPNDGSQLWNVVGPATNDALIRVRSRFDAAVADDSDAAFTIPPADITVTAPNGGESVLIGSQL